MKIINIILEHKLAVLVGIIVLLSIAIINLPKLETSIDFDAYYPKGDPELDFYHMIKDELGNDEEIILTAIKSENDVLGKAFLHRIDSLTTEIESSPGIEKVSDLTKLKFYKKSPFGFLSRRYINPEQDSTSGHSGSQLERDSFYTSRFYDREEGIIFIYIQLDRKLSSDSIDLSLAELKETIQGHGFENFHLYGRKYLESEYKEIISKELTGSVGYTILVIIVILVFFFRSIKGIAISVSSMLLALILFYGCLSILGRSLGIMSNLFPTIILIVGISDVIHILSAYDHEYQTGSDIETSTRKVIRNIGLAILLTSLTTAIGFLTLCSSTMEAISSFGLEAAIAVLIAFAFSIIWTPLLLYQFNLRVPLHSRIGTFDWEKISKWIYGIVENKPQLIGYVSIIILAISFLGSSKLNYNNHSSLSNFLIINGRRKRSTITAAMSMILTRYPKTRTSHESDLTRIRKPPIKMIEVVMIALPVSLMHF